MLNAIAGETTQDGFRLCRSEPKTCGHFDHFVILLPDKIPVDGTPQDQLEVRILFGITRFHQREFLSMDALEAGKEPKTQREHTAKATSD